ncbi:MAG: hypothetical protein IJQ81_15025, partial [Oscillibacter sp.]|nr:hypothetical protein [Oscillibacter sp.]
MPAKVETMMYVRENRGTVSVRKSPNPLPARTPCVSPDWIGLSDRNPSTIPVAALSAAISPT